MIPRAYFATLLLIAILWVIFERSFESVSTVVTAVGALVAREYKIFLDSRKAADPNFQPPDLDAVVTSTVGAFLKAHWRTIANGLAVVATATFLIFGLVQGVREVSTWIGLQRTKFDNWLHEMEADQKRRDSEKEAALAHLKEVYQSVSVTDYSWDTVAMSEEAQGQIVNTIKGHKHVAYASFTVKTTTHPLKDFTIRLRITPPSGTEKEDVISDTIYEEIPINSTRIFPRMRIGTTKFSTGKAGIDAIPKSE